MTNIRIVVVEDEAATARPDPYLARGRDAGHSRQFILHRNAFIEAKFYFNGRLLVKVLPQPQEQVIISKAKSAEFKKWMDS